MRPPIALLASSLVGLLLLLGLTASPSFATFEITSIECKEGVPTLCIEHNGALFEAKGTETYVGKLVAGTEALMSAKFGETEIHIVCTTDESIGEIKQTEPLVAAVTAQGVLKLGGCKLLEPLAAKCAVPESLTTNTLSGTVIDEMPVRQGVVKAAVGSTIIELEFKNATGGTCPATIKGVKRVAGEDTCETLEPEVDKVTQVGECLPAGSKLKLGENAAEFLCTAEVELSGGNKGAKWTVSLA
jgi:hypothetical protein